VRYQAALIVVDDVARSRSFYEGLLGQAVESDFGENVAFKGGFSIHKKEHYSALLGGAPIGSKANDAELYFEDDDVARACSALEAAGVEFVHPAREQPWRQLVARFYDPDGHIVEVGESLEHVAFRMSEEGCSLDEICRCTYFTRPRALRAIGAYSAGLFGVVIESDRLMQVPIRRDFEEAIFREFTPEVARYTWPQPTGDRADTRAFIDGALAGLARGDGLQLVVLDKASGGFIGCSGLHGIGGESPELGIWTASRSRGNGFGLEAVTAIIAWARERLDFERLRYPVARANVASRRVAEANGGAIAGERMTVNQAGAEFDEVEYWIPRYAKAIPGEERA